jgi:uncharacterized paraquat-inducible protein A
VWRLPGFGGSNRALYLGRGALLRRGSGPLAVGSCHLVHITAPDFLPFMSLSLEGRIWAANRVTGASEPFDRGLYPAGAVTITIPAPSLNTASVICRLLGLRLNRPPPRPPPAFRLAEKLALRAMIEIHTLGVFVAWVTLTVPATVHLARAPYAGATMMLTTAASAAIDAGARGPAGWRFHEYAEQSPQVAVESRSNIGNL